MQYKIPQNVGIEDKIVGPLSLRQLIIVAVGTGISWVLFAIMSKVYELNFIEYAIIALPALLSAAFALIRINDQSLTKYLQLLLEFSMKPKRRLWDHRGIAFLVDPDLGDAVIAESTVLNEAMLAKSQKANNLKQLSLVLDSGGFEHVKAPEHRDIDAAQDENLVVQAYFGNDDKEKMNMYWRTIESHKKRLNLIAKLSTARLTAGTAETELVRQEIAKAKEAGEAARRLASAAQTKPQASTAPGPRPATASVPKTQASKPQPGKTEASITKPTIPEKPSPQVQKNPKISVPFKAETSLKPAPKPTLPAKPQTPQKVNPKPTPTSQSGAPLATPPLTPKTVPAPTPKQPNKTVPKVEMPTPSQTPPTQSKTEFPKIPNKKQVQKPVRQGHVDTTQKNAPAQYVPKTPAKPPTLPKQPPQTPSVPLAEKAKDTPPKPVGGSKGGEFQFEELKKGEIEINLD